MKAFPITLGALLLTACAADKPLNPDADPIRINQLGYYTNQSKTATIEDAATRDDYRILDATTRQVVWEGEAARMCTSAWNDTLRHVIDFSALTQPGRYILEAQPYSKEFTIADHPLHEAAIAAIKALYYQRTGEVIDAQWAGQWARPAAHPDTEVLVHASAASKERPEGTVIASPGGWYDAGDYNKYIVNSGFTIGQILTVYQLCPNYFKGLSLNIPESGNATPDVLDELLVNLRWMLTMQDPSDGGVYHKLTTPSFEAFVMPTECHQQRYVVQKSTPAALDFAATMAISARVYKEYEEYKDFADQALKAAIDAYKWAQRHPSVAYRQGEMNEKFDPDIFTGEYGDGDFHDEFFWAASELYFSTGKTLYLNAAASYAPKEYRLPVWGDVTGLGMWSWLVQQTYGFSQDADRLGNRFQQKILAYCDTLLATQPTSCYDSPYGNAPADFGWGCLAESGCGQGLSLLFAYRMTSDARYLHGALKVADYLLGRNATGYCYLTGFGQRPVMNPHHRISAADGIEAPIPGFLCGGPNNGQQDHCEGYPSDRPDESYLDRTESYASNEVAINWQAGIFSLLGWLDAVVK